MSFIRTSNKHITRLYQNHHSLTHSLRLTKHSSRNILATTATVRNIFSQQQQQQQQRDLTISACIIGDEILSGRILDINSNHIAKKCFERGVELSRVEIVRDIEQEIADTVKRLSKTSDIVITTGGIGPTHDDITYQSIAHAYNLGLVHNLPTLERMVAKMTKVMNRSNVKAILPDPHGTPEQVACARMALLPEDSQIHYPCDELWVPIVTVNKNVHIFPGVPRIFQQLFSADFGRLLQIASAKNKISSTTTAAISGSSSSSSSSSVVDGIKDGRMSSIEFDDSAGGGGGGGSDTVVVEKKFYRALVRTTRPEHRESLLAPILSRIQKKYIGKLKIGSYPTSWAPDNNTMPNSVIVSVVGNSRELVEVCQQEILDSITDSEPVNEEDDPGVIPMPPI
ncbi:hypothetical protein H4219_002502 [Mycoemilia scoparia]|uniref:MoaB/Mog domain-containing protein n=1 Tax=Mycoemilia scoparia TaxID=417184 RepID=A0A9W8DTZ8_9FUNG|nr:hypothetical protein H4219_002502 [Mycoemilia scoparia]